MGIKRLNKFLRSKSLVTEYSSFDEYIRNAIYKKNPVIVIDEGEYHRYKIALGKNAILGMLNKILQFMLRGTLPLFIFGGVAPLAKKGAIQNRLKKIQKNKENIQAIVKKMHYSIPLNDVTSQIEQWKEKHPELSNIELDIYNFVETQKYMDIPENISNDIWFNTGNMNDFEEKIVKSNRQSVTVTYEELETVKILLKILNVPYLEADGEADALCAALYKMGLVYCCLTNDMDLLPFGCYRIIQIHPDKKVTEFDLNRILEKLNLTLDQFIDMCILMGSDYVSYSPRLKPDEIYDKILEFKSLENFIDEHKKMEPNISLFKDKYMETKILYKSCPEKEISYVKEHITNFDILLSITNVINCRKLLQFIEPYIKYNIDGNAKKHYIENCIKNINKLIEKGKFKKIC